MVAAVELVRDYGNVGQYNNPIPDQYTRVAVINTASSVCFQNNHISQTINTSRVLPFDFKTRTAEATDTK